MTKKTLLKLTMSSMMVLTLIGCGGGGGSTGNNNSSNNPVGNGNNDPYKIVPVSYTLNGSEAPSCPGAYDVSVSKAQTDNGYGMTQCTWLCGEYEGAKPVVVVLSFEQDGKDAPWTFDRDLVSTAPAQCHN